MAHTFDELVEKQRASDQAQEQVEQLRDKYGPPAAEPWSEQQVDVATNLLNGRIRLSLLWTQEIYLTPDDAEQVAHALLRAAERGRGPGPVSA
ncbi:AAA-like domain-containing protein [Streptomyces sp. NPDC057062]|uniref:AAA-like domain-containing protein n=1 Tax=unclassified Streptomyces TaxID=2593676 RepID=UPI001C6EDE35|nr:AAA-like domain-containing protein [Streptomyces sp. MBT84]